MNRLRLTINTNPTHVKYGLFFLFLFSMIITVRSYINYQNIIVSINKVNEDTLEIQQKKLYEQNMVLAYQQTDTAKYFLGHENNIIFPGEFVIRFEQASVTNNQESATQTSNTINDPKQARKHYFQSIIQKNK